MESVPEDQQEITEETEPVTQESEPTEKDPALSPIHEEQVEEEKPEPKKKTQPKSTKLVIVPVAQPKAEPPPPTQAEPPTPKIRQQELLECPDCKKMLTKKTLNYSHKRICPGKNTNTINSNDARTPDKNIRTTTPSSSSSDIARGSNTNVSRANTHEDAKNDTPPNRTKSRAPANDYDDEPPVIATRAYTTASERRRARINSLISQAF